MKNQTRKSPVKPASERPKKRANGKRAHGESNGATNGGPSKVPQPHGGALNSGGTPGHKGAGGRTRNEVRELALHGFEKNLPRLIRIAAGTEYRTALDSEGDAVQVQPTFRESVEAMRELGNRGVGKMLEIEIPRTPVSFGVLVCPADAAEMLEAEALRVRGLIP